MKKLLLIMTVLFISLAMSAQQTEDEVYVGKGKTFGNYKQRGFGEGNTKPATGEIAFSGIVTEVIGKNVKDSLKGSGGFIAFNIKKDDGSIILIGTRDHGFTVPDALVGHSITVQGIDAVSFGRKRRDIKSQNQKDIQLVAYGLLVL